MRNTGRSHFDGQDDVANVRSAVDIVRLVGEFVQLHKAGREMKGLCPFHDDHSPSMSVVPSKGIFHCFVCGTGGDAITFIRKYLKLEFREALEFLAEKYNVKLTPRRSQLTPDGQPATPRAELIRANAIAAGFFRTLLSHEQHGKAGREILDKRAVSPEMREKFLLGVSPGGADLWDGFAQYLRKQGHDETLFIDAGLLKRRERSPGCYDAFRNRIMFPIQDIGGRVIAFGARRIDDADEPKYINSSESRIFEKKSTLYALSQATQSIQTRRTAIITEGYMDTIACHQAGFTNTVAVLGTALTREHARLLRRLCSNVVLLFDGDKAGQSAADRSVEIFFAESLNVKVATLAAFTDAKDPDELFKRDGGREVFEMVLAEAPDLLRYRFDRLRARLRGTSSNELADALTEEVGRLVDLGLKDVPLLRQKLIVKDLAAIASVPEHVIEKIIPAGRSAPRAYVAPDQPDEEPPASPDEVPQIDEIVARPLTDNEGLLGCLLCEGSLWERLPMESQDAIAPAAYRWPLVQRLAQLVRDIVDDGSAPVLSNVLAATDDESVRQLAVTIASKVDTITDRSDRVVAHFDDCLQRIRVERGQAGMAGATPLEAIELKRQLLQKHGPNRRALPRPR